MTTNEQAIAIDALAKMLQASTNAILAIAYGATPDEPILPDATPEEELLVEPELANG